MKILNQFKNRIFIFIALFAISILISENILAQSYTRAWIQTYGNDSAASNYEPIQINIDHNDFVYVLSNKDSSSGMKSMSLIKYDASGNVLWSNVYSNAGNRDVRSIGIAFDAMNNVYVGADEGNYMVIKYNSAGNFIWKVNFSAIGGYDDTPYDMKVTDAGTVYITGVGSLSSGPNYYTDAWTCKIDSSGNLIWDKYYNYPGIIQCWDYAHFLRLDKEENLIIAGTLQGLTNVCKFDSSGNLLWTCNQPIPSTIKDLATDDSCNIYIAGQSSLIKLDSSGFTVFNKTFTFPNGSDINSIQIKDANIFATGYAVIDTAHHADVLTIKFDKNGDTVWTAVYNDAGNLSEFGNKIICDNSGDIFSAGRINNSSTFSDILILKYDTAGNFSWAKQCGSSLSNYDNYFCGAVSDTNNNLLVAALVSTGNNSLGVMKIDSTGNTTWTDKQYNYQNLDDQAAKITHDGHGNYVVGGYSTGMQFSQDLELVKYNNVGNQLWERRFHYFPRNRISLSQIICDSLDNIYICATIDSNSNSFLSNMLVMKLDSTGNTIWTDMQSSIGNAMVFGEHGSLYILGMFTLGQWLHNVILFKYDVAGNHLWTKSVMDTAYIDNTIPKCLRFDGHLNLYSTFTGVSSSNHQQDYVTAKLDTAGNVLWKKVYDGPTSRVDISKILLLDQKLNPIVIGHSDSLNYDISIVKYDSSGQQLWDVRYNGLGNHWDVPNDAICDSLGNIYITGQSDDSSYVSDCFTMKVDSAGNIIWTSAYISGYTGFPYSIGNAIALDNWGNAICAGQGYDSNGKSNLLVLVYDSLGSPIYTDLYHQAFPQSNNAQAVDVVADGSGSFFVTGFADTHASMIDFVTIKYFDILLTVDDLKTKENTMLIFPNPFNHSLNISYESTQNSEATVEIFDMKGKLISKEQIQLTGGINSIQIITDQMNSGTYMLVLRNNDERISRRIISIN